MEESSGTKLMAMAEAAVRESIAAKEACLKHLGAITAMADVVARAFRGGHKLFLFGNGGSAADAQHLAAEFVNRFRIERPPLPALALTVDTSVLTSISNDYHFEEVFQKQLRALAHPEDVVLGISTSGHSANVIEALKWAREHGLHTVGMAGIEQTEMDGHCDLIFHAPSRVTARIQECHILVGHILCELVDESLFGDSERNA